MGCATSKLDDLPAVALCRDRCGFLDEAIRQRYALAEAHVAYTRSLAAVSRSLHHFLEHSGVADSGHISSPVLDLPPKGKGGETAVTCPASEEAVVHGGDSLSDSGSHLNFHYDTDESSSSLHPHSGHMYISTDHEDGALSSFQGGVLHMNYMQSRAAPSRVVYEQRPPMMSEGTVRYFGEEEKSSLYYPFSYHEANVYPNSGASSYLDPFYSSPPPNYGSSSAASSSRPPPPPPPLPRASAWDFLNPFETYDNKYDSQYSSSSRDLTELRKEEGIPDLEDEHEVMVKEVDGDHLEFGDVGHSKPVDADVVAHDPEDSKVQGEASVSETGSSGVSVDSDSVEYEVHVVENEVHGSEPKSSNGGGSAMGPKVYRGLSEVVREIEVQFERASESGNEIAKMLEAGKLPYHRKHHQVTSKLVLTGTPSTVSSEPSTSGTEPPSSFEGTGPAQLGFEEEVGMKSGNLSSTLQKLYLWEKKLYNEVKAEEKMRVVHDRKVEKLKRLHERGAEAHKMESTRAVVRTLSVKIRMAIQIVDKISITVNRIRDEELWPQLKELIQGLTRMWKSMLECHRSQCQAMKQARSFDPIGSGKKLGSAHMDATLQFERELLYWTERFSMWVSAQKGFVRALNNWLLKCLLYEPEETPDGIVPFSPGRIGAPPVFVICNQWSQALDEIREMKVISSLHVFATSVFQRWERDKVEMQQMIVADRDLERKVRDEDQKIQKEIHALEKKMVLVSGEGETLSASGRLVYQSDVSGYNFQASLQRIFEAMESFTEQSVRLYEELLERSAQQANSGAQED
ncbi:protein ALTERED PHOSPHATE STARVATION RESPONSE 1-like isoform X2 [Punica granatum]|uniref:Protein ALTERED PHOSPHATE STARVATION RESPONSE 1-like isoform X2 n=1 Tax=Punica granatum TaxID=22663 RepID=A0A218X709_PUNGR|nr:protein ALTERED PHOSPHATE STARVATION RESPONSE 1-like isoform X2 [Punica granatum]OWM80489.1 hypothetical protein CDL15_Pgr019769 [Punica granatum]